VSLLNPVERTARGAKLQPIDRLPTAEPATLVQASWRDYVYAEVWARPALDLRSRFLIAIGSAAGASDSAADGALCARCLEYR